jgi:hypothetical protein
MTHRDRMKDKLAKVKAHLESAQRLGNEAEAEAFATTLNRLLLQYELSEDELAPSRKDDEPIVELKVAARPGLVARQTRVAWQERLASIIAEANLCKILIRSRSNDVWFVGARSHAEVAEYTYAKLVVDLEVIATNAYSDAFHAAQRTCCLCGKPRREHVVMTDGDRLCDDGQLYASNVAAVRGYRPAFLSGFVTRIAQRLVEERRTVVAEVDLAAGDSCTALVKLDGALARVKTYIDAKYRKRHVAPVGYRRLSCARGRLDGQAAADGIQFTRGVTGAPTAMPKQLQ